MFALGLCSRAGSGGERCPRACAFHSGTGTQVGGWVMPENQAVDRVFRQPGIAMKLAMENS